MIEPDVTGEIAYDLRGCYYTVKFPTQSISIFSLGTEDVEIEERVVPIEFDVISFTTIVEAEHRESPSCNSPRKMR